MKLSTRKSLAMSFVVLLGAVAMAVTALRVRLALEDPHMALALEAVEGPSRLSWLRGKTFLLLGADPDAPILHWGINVPPLVACVESGNDALAQAIVTESSRETWLQAVVRLCESPNPHAGVLHALAVAGDVMPSQLCSR